MPDSAWLGTLYRQFRRELFVTAWTVLRQAEPAEDAVQAAFAKLARLAAPPTEPKLYVFRSVRNAAIDLAQARSRRREEPLSPACDRAEPELNLPDAELLASLAELLARLDDDAREVIHLHLHAALTFQEIAELRDEPLPTVASRYRRALDKLARQIQVRHA